MFKEFLNVANEEELLGGKPFQTFTTRSLKSVTKGDGETDRQNGCSVVPQFAVAKWKPG